ncbi:MAG: anhydro-N-acetylmuramic acid kinase [Clostridia bacterium]|nr:anhydro-N-acetylmuramic acid kinase [Clostridia bacterium]
MHSLLALLEKPSRLVIGLMSGTSADAVDASLVEISGHGLSTRVKPLAFHSEPFPLQVREKILSLAGGMPATAREFSQMSFLLGQLYVQCCEHLLKSAGKEHVDLIGSHGQTLWHVPVAEEYLSYQVSSTFQTGEASLLCERFSCVAVSDFRVRDIAAGGQGAPLVPYVDYLLYRTEDETTALQNIGGIGNISLLPPGCAPEDVIAFDTGPGNMLMDQWIARMTNGEYQFDPGGFYAMKGKISESLLSFLLSDPYLNKQPPKTTGREHFGPEYIAKIAEHAHTEAIPDIDVLRTLTHFTAKTIADAGQLVSCIPDRLIVSGGGAKNRTLMQDLRELLPSTRVLTQEDLGMSSQAKEGIAFAVLANEAIFASCGNMPNVTGARHPVVMGKISLP